MLGDGKRIGRYVLVGSADGKTVYGVYKHSAPSANEVLNHAHKASDLPAGQMSPGIVVATNKRRMGVRNGKPDKQGTKSAKGKGKAGKGVGANKNAGFSGDGAAAAGAAGGQMTIEQALNGDNVAHKRFANLVAAYAHQRRLLASAIRNGLGRVTIRLVPGIDRIDVEAQTRAGTLLLPQLERRLADTLRWPKKAHLGAAPKPLPKRLLAIGEAGLDPLLRALRERSKPDAVWREVVGKKGLAAASSSAIAAAEQAMKGFSVSERYAVLMRLITLDVTVHNRPFRMLTPRLR